jgi:hypothetical protein
MKKIGWFLCLLLKRYDALRRFERSLPPHPGPLPWGEGESQPVVVARLAHLEIYRLAQIPNVIVMVRACLTAILVLFTLSANAHLGSPDVFYEGTIGPYRAHVIIRMPTVVPGRAEIFVRMETNQPVDVFVRPLYADSDVANAPPADRGTAVPGETNLYTGDLWLMTFGSYSIEVKIHGPSGDGAVEIPVNSVALKQMPLPDYMGNLLAGLGALLFFGGAAIVMGAARDGALAPGDSPNGWQRLKGWIAGTVTALIFAGALIFGNWWWKVEERGFREKLGIGRAPQLTAETRVEGAQRILRLTFGNPFSDSDKELRLLPDHGKLLHLFLVRQGNRDAFAHLHPIRKGDKAFELALPPLPAGRYDIFCDLAFEKSGLSATATNVVTLPEIPKADSGATAMLDADPDDSWAGAPRANLPAAGTATNLVCGLATGQRVVWKAHPQPRARRDARLQFEVLDASGNPAALEPYMGMMCHAAVLKSDNSVFAHLHPSGNFSMAAQNFFESKLAREARGATSDSDKMPGMDHSMMMPGQHANGSTISLPYEFPVPGDYRIWVQFKTAGQVLTAVFDTTVTEK